MLTNIHLINYRGFEDHQVKIRPVSVVVGKNNAGKSTFIEAIRLISIITNRLPNLNFKTAPNWSKYGRAYRGVSPSLEGLEIDYKGIFYHYNEPPATIIAKFDSGITVELNIGPEVKCFALIKDKKGNIINSKASAKILKLAELNILPQISPLIHDEQILVDRYYVIKNMSSYLSSRHFRNQLRLFHSEYRRFRILAEETWPGLRILSLDGARGYPGQVLDLFIQDRDFVGEAALMGQGLQMWLQTLWFLARCNEESTVILDEPDVYMHPDLQRKIIRMVKNKYRQVILTTHSVEIMAEADPTEILVIDRNRKRSKFADTEPMVQAMIENIGGIHNLHLARLWSSKKCMFIEGKDMSYLKIIHYLLYPKSETPLDIIPNMTIGGWGGWNYAIGGSIILKNAFGEKITNYCILDKDYHTPEEIQKRKADAKLKNINLYIWKRKEIENYLILPQVIQRLIISKVSDNTNGPGIDEIEKEIEKIILKRKNHIIDCYADSFLHGNKRGAATWANKQARRIVADAMSKRENQITIVSGKEVLRRLSNWSKNKYNVSFGVRAILKSLQVEDIPAEMRYVIDTIEAGNSFE